MDTVVSFNARRKGMLTALALFALAQGVWLAAEFGNERTRLAERLAVMARDPVPAALRQEADSAVRYLAFVRSQAEVVLKERIRERVDEAVAIATSIHQQAQGKVPPAMLRTLVREGLRAPRFFDGRGYYFIDDFDGNCVLLPTAPEREGNSLVDNRDDTGRYIMRELIRAAEQPGGAGYVRYRWYAPHSGAQMEEKIAYVRAFPQLGWLIGTGDYTSMVEEDLKVEALKRLRSVSFPVGGSLAVVDGNGVVRLFPDAPAVEGRRVEDVPDGPERRALEALRAAAAQGHGNARYQWASPATGRLGHRQAWVSHPGTWGWTVAAVADATEPHGTEGGEQWARLTLRFVLPALALVLALGGIVIVALPKAETGNTEDGNAG